MGDKVLTKQDFQKRSKINNEKLQFFIDSGILEDGIAALARLHRRTTRPPPIRGEALREVESAGRMDLGHQAQIAVVFDKMFPAIEVDVGPGLEVPAKHGLQARPPVGKPDRINAQPFEPAEQHQTVDSQKTGVLGGPDYRVQPV